jgi:mannosyltransferase OCH1-like enzyme
LIPKIIHQTWKNSEIPEEYILFQQKVKKLHPDWEYKLWTDENNLQFVKDYFPQLLKKYVALPKNIMRADVIRYLIMQKIGGLYLDLDYEMIKPFDILEYGLVLPYNRSIESGDTYNAFGNCIFASSPGHKFWEFVIKEFEEISDYDSRFKLLSKKKYNTKNASLEEVITGPGFLTGIFYTYEKKLENYILPDREKFHPIYPRNNKEYLKILANKKSYGIHHCAGSWRDKSLLKRGLRSMSLFKPR